MADMTTSSSMPQMWSPAVPVSLLIQWLCDYVKRSSSTCAGFRVLCCMLPPTNREARDSRECGQASAGCQYFAVVIHKKKRIAVWQALWLWRGLTERPCCPGPEAPRDAATTHG